MAGEEVDLVDRRHAFSINAARLHEAQCSVDLVGHLCVPLTCRRGGDELTIPGVDLAQVGVATPRERSEEVECRGGPVVRSEQALRIRSSLRLGEPDVVHDLAEEGRELGVALRLGRR